MHCIQKWGSFSLSLIISIFSYPAIANTYSVDNSRLCQKDLAQKITHIVNSPQYDKAYWGIQIKTLHSQRILYSLNSDKYIIPASSLKLLTTAALISKLGSKYRITTPVYSVGNAPNLNSLRIAGRGDPTISTQSLKSIVRRLRLQGVKKIEKLIVDDRYFDAPKINPTWEWSDTYSYYATSISSLILDGNIVTLTLLPQELGEPVKLKWHNAIAARQWQINNQALTVSTDTPYNIEIFRSSRTSTLNIKGELAANAAPDIWDLAIVDSANYFLESLWIVLENSGIDVLRGEIARENFSNTLETQNTRLVSPDLSQMILEINRNSNNLYAEVLAEVLRQEIGSITKHKAVAESLSKLGIKTEKYKLVDASGLSRHNLVTPEVLIQILEIMSASKQSMIYRNSLAIAGKTGTLKNRFKNTDIEARLWGKTGSLTGVSALTGYLELPNYEPLIFTITINNSQLSSQKLRQAIDKIVVLLSYLSPC